MAATDPLADAKRLLRTQPAGARVLAQSAHRKTPSSGATLLLAVTHRRCGDAHAALALLAPLSAALPRAWGVQFEYGVALAVTGDLLGAIAALRRATALNPKATVARHALRDLTVMAGAPVDLSPPTAMADPVLRAATIGYFKGDPAACDALARFGLDPDDVVTACLLADIGAGDHDAVADLLQSALRSAPTYLPAQLRLAEALHRSSRDGEALAAIRPVIASAPGLAAAITLNAAILMMLGRASEAVDLLSRATMDAGAHATVWQSYGHALRAIGRRDEAVAAYRAAIRVAPGFGEAYWSIADMKTAALAPVDVAAMKQMLAGESIDPACRAHLHFAVGRAREDDGDSSDAFTHYRLANALRRKREPHDSDAHATFVRRMMATFDAGFFADRPSSGIAASDPIFVIGMPRSGSTLVEQILATHSMVEGMSELPDITAIARGIAASGPYPDVLMKLRPEQFATLGADYLARTRSRRRSHRPRFVDKFPGNAFHIGLIHLILPNARIIDVRRDPRDCCLSLFTQSFAAGQAYSYDLTDLGRFYADYRALMAHFDAVLPGRVLRIDYEALIDDAEGETRRMLDHCGLPFEPACLRFFETARVVRTASSEQVRQPLYRGSIGRWRRFEPWLGPLFEALRPDEAIEAS